MFAVANGGLQVASEGDIRSHIEWVVDEGWLTSETAEEFRNMLRGFYDKRGLFFYRDHNFRAIFPHHYPDWRQYLRLLKETLNLPNNTLIYSGMSPGELGDAWEGAVLLKKTLGEFLREPEENSEDPDP
jgi:hypothetical protein